MILIIFIPKYILPTQPPSRFNRNQAEFYRSKDNYSVIAYYMEGYLSALLDSHRKAVARIQWAGDISNEKLNRIINNEEALSSEDALNIATALYKLKNNRFKELTFYFCRLDAWKDVRFDLYTLLSNIKDQEVEDFFIEYLVNYDYYYSEEDVKKVVDDYFVS